MDELLRAFLFRIIAPMIYLGGWSIVVARSAMSLQASWKKMDLKGVALSLWVIVLCVHWYLEGLFA
jgi:hypothetical protein